MKLSYSISFFCATIYFLMMLSLKMSSHPIHLPSFLSLSFSLSISLFHVFILFLVHGRTGFPLNSCSTSTPACLRPRVSTLNILYRLSLHSVKSNVTVENWLHLNSTCMRHSEHWIYPWTHEHNVLTAELFSHISFPVWLGLTSCFHDTINKPSCLRKTLMSDRFLHRIKKQW